MGNSPAGDYTGTVRVHARAHLDAMCIGCGALAEQVAPTQRRSLAAALVGSAHSNQNVSSTCSPLRERRLMVTRASVPGGGGRWGGYNVFGKESAKHSRSGVSVLDSVRKWATESCGALRHAPSRRGESKRGGHGIRRCTCSLNCIVYLSTHCFSAK